MHVAGACRLFWTKDKRFLDQFKNGDMSAKFKSFSKYPPVFKDMTFWITEKFTENNLAEIVRNAGSLTLALGSLWGQRFVVPSASFTGHAGICFLRWAVQCSWQQLSQVGHMVRDSFVFSTYLSFVESIPSTSK
jgi:hypothetical protein